MRLSKGSTRRLNSESPLRRSVQSTSPAWLRPHPSLGGRRGHGRGPDGLQLVVGHDSYLAQETQVVGHVPLFHQLSAANAVDGHQFIARTVSGRRCTPHFKRGLLGTGPAQPHHHLVTFGLEILDRNLQVGKVRQVSWARRTSSLLPGSLRYGRLGLWRTESSVRDVSARSGRRLLYTSSQ